MSIGRTGPIPARDYLGVAIAVVAFAGLDRAAAFDDDDAILSTLANDVLGNPWDQIVVLAVLTSALARRRRTSAPSGPRRCCCAWRPGTTRVIVIGCYGESPLRGAVLGSTPHKLLHLSERPVLAVPAAGR